MSKLIIWTRSLEDWQEDQNRYFDQASSHVMHIPCLTTLARPFTPPQRPHYDIIIFTSVKAVEYATMNPELLLHIQSAARIYTIGKATYQSLASKGIHAIHPHTIKNSGQLTDYIIKNESREHAILLPGAKARAFDAASRLSEANFYAENLDIYETVSASRIAPEKMQIMEQDHISPVICFASPSAVHGFISGCDEKLELLAQKSIAVAIGLTTDAACQPHFQKTCSASEPTLASLAAMAAEIYRRC